MNSPSFMNFRFLFVLAVTVAVFACKKEPAITDFAAPGDRKHAEEEMRTYKNFTYKGWLVTAPDGGVVGVSVELYNLSNTTALKMRSAPDCIPIGVVVNEWEKIHVGVWKVDLHNAVVPASATSSKKLSKVKWKIPPSSVKRYFIPMRSLIREMPNGHRIGPCNLAVHMNAYPDWVPEGLMEPPFVPLGFVQVFVTKQALEADPIKALKEALAASGEVDESHYIKPQIDGVK